MARATLQQGTHVLPILLGGIPILLLGIVDDLRGMRALPKLLVEIAVALGLYWQDCGCSARAVRRGRLNFRSFGPLL